MIMVDFQWSIRQTCCFPRVDTAMGRPSVGMTGRYILPPLCNEDLRFATVLAFRLAAFAITAKGCGGRVPRVSTYGRNIAPRARRQFRTAFD